MGGNSLGLYVVTATQFAGLVTNKILFNSTVSTPGDRFCTFDIKDFYYVSLVSNCEYMRKQLEVIPQDIIDQYDLETIQHERWIYI